MCQIDFFIFIGLKWFGNIQGSFVADNFHKRMEWDGETAVELHQDVIRKSHLPNECLIDPGLTRDLPAKNLKRILSEYAARVADWITSDIPNTSTSHRGIETNISIVVKGES